MILLALLAFASVETSTVPPASGVGARRVFDLALDAAELAEEALVDRDLERGKRKALELELEAVVGLLRQAEEAATQNLEAYLEQRGNVDRLQASELRLRDATVQANKRAKRLNRQRTWLWVGLGVAAGAAIVGFAAR